MRFSLFFILLFFAFALSKNAPETVSPMPFSSGKLFAALDSAGNGATWMEFDSGGILDGEVGKILSDGRGNLKKGFEHAWLLELPGQRFKMAVLSKRGAGEALSFYEIGKLSSRPEPLTLQEPLDPAKVFRDYRETTRGRFVHRDDSNLQVQVREGEIWFAYFKPDLQSLLPVSNWSVLSEAEKRQEIQTRKDFYAYEYSLMVQAFIASTHGLFNWQVWHWLMPEWISGAKIGDAEISRLLSSPDQGRFVRIFFKELPGGDSVEMLSNAHGTFWMMIRRK